MGGMGNQLFQYAIGRSLAEKNSNCKMKMDITGYFDQSGGITPRSYALGVFNIGENFSDKKEIIQIKGGVYGFVSSLVCRFKKNKTEEKDTFFREPRFSFSPEILKIKGDAYLEGYWQTEKYFQDVEDVIRREFTLKKEFSIEDKEITKEIKNSNAVSLHIRRGDYVANASTSKFHGICGLEYYANAVGIIGEKVKNPVIYIFSDDIEWVKKNLKIDYPVRYVSDGILKDYEELMLMSYCKHNIIANSSFSWWGAWLNNYPEKIVIAPRQWFADQSVDTSDVIPGEWIKI